MGAVALTYSARGQMKYVSQKASPDHERNRLVMEYTDMVRRVALHMADKCDGAVDADDLIQTGLVGLLEAAERYVPVAGVPFEAFALTRVRGAMLDSLRRDDWCPRQYRKQGRLVKNVRAQLQQKFGRMPSEQEVAAAAGITVAELQKVETVLDRVGTVSFELAREQGDEPCADGPDQSSQPVIHLRRQQALARALKTLPEREQMIMHLYYQEELNQKEVARVLGLTEARISQLRSKTVKKLHQRLSEWI